VSRNDRRLAHEEWPRIRTGSPAGDDAKPVARLRRARDAAGDDHRLLLDEGRIYAQTVARRVPFTNHRPLREELLNGHARRRFPTGMVFTYEPCDFDDAHGLPVGGVTLAATVGWPRLARGRFTFAATALLLAPLTAMSAAVAGLPTEPPGLTAGLQNLGPPAVRGFGPFHRPAPPVGCPPLARGMRHARRYSRCPRLARGRLTFAAKDSGTSP